MAENQKDPSEKTNQSGQQSNQKNQGSQYQQNRTSAEEPTTVEEDDERELGTKMPGKEKLSPVAEREKNQADKKNQKDLNQDPKTNTDNSKNN